jgi:hypothetical protein
MDISIGAFEISILYPCVAPDAEKRCSHWARLRCLGSLNALQDKKLLT